MHQYIYLVPLFPLIGFLIVGLGRNILPKGISGWIASIAVLASFIVSVLIFNEVRTTPAEFPKVVELYSFINTQSLSINFAFQVDQLSTLFLLVITGIGFLIHMYSIAYMHEENQAWFAKFFAYLNLFIFSMLLLVLGSNYIIMFIGWEGVGLCSYLLIGYWYKKNDYTNAAKKAFIMNRIGDLGFLIGIFLIIGQFGSADFATVFTKAGALSAINTPILLGITLCLFIGACGKSAQIPLFTWLPDAMAGPTPVSALIHAATMVTAGIYMIVRSNVLFSLAPVAQDIILLIGMLTAIVSATIATRQNDIKKVLAYSTVSQLGFMFIALGVGAYTAAVFHVVTHAFFKALLFLGSGSVIHGMHHEQDIRKMGGLKKYMPVTYITFLIGCIAIAGIPPLSGFFSKDEIMMHVYQHGAYGKILWGIILCAAMLTAYYMFRLLFLTFFGQYRGDAHHHPHESPALMTIPLIILAVLSAIGGALGLPHVFHLGDHWLHNHLSPLYAKVGSALHHATELSASTEYALMAVAVIAAVVSIFIAYREYKNIDLKKPFGGLASFFAGKWFFDEAYDKTITNSSKALSTAFNNYAEPKVIDKAVNGVGDLVQAGAKRLRLIQSGMVGFYMFIMVVGALAIFATMFLLKH
jgi:NADH-quinone oxidoreductase subunit L